MAGSLAPINIGAPGFYGLNTQDSPTGLDPKFCLEAKNVVIDRSGRLAARKGWERFIAADATILANGVSLVHEYINSVGDTELIIAVPGGYIYSVDSSGTAVSIYTAGDWSSTQWKAVNFNNKCYFFQRGHTPLVYDGTSCIKITAAGAYTGTVQTAHAVLAAFGRLWSGDTLTDKITVKWSDTLIGEAWTGGAAGSLDLNTVYGAGVRPITALASFNGKLVIFCDKTIILYDGANDPSTMTLSDVIHGVGCIARDTVIDIGTDILFLSDSGVRSLGRVINEKSAPINDISKNVRDALIDDVVLQNNYDAIKAGYNEKDGYYLLSLPAVKKSYCFDLKQRLQDGSARITTWTLAPLSMTQRLNRDFVFGFSNGVGRSSTTYTDDSASYEMSYFSSHLSAGDLTNLLILKFLRLMGYGGAGYRIRFLWGTDYEGLPNQTQASFPSAGAASEYNSAEYAIGEYGSSVPTIRGLRQNLSGAGRVFQIGIQVPINGLAFSLQQIDVFVKKGRTSTV